MGMNPVSDNYVISVMAKEKTPKKAETAPDEQLEMESVDLKSLVSQPEENGLLMAVPAKIPVLALRDVIIFPYMIFPVLVGRETSLSATMSSMAREKYLFLVAQKNSAVDDPNKDELFHHGTLAKIVRIIRLPNGLVKVLV